MFGETHRYISRAYFPDFPPNASPDGLAWLFWLLTFYPLERRLRELLLRVVKLDPNPVGYRALFYRWSATA